MRSRRRELGVDAIGLVFVPCAANAAVDIQRRRATSCAPACRRCLVWLRVDGCNEPSRSRQIVQIGAVPLELLQFHGSRRPRVRRNLECPGVKALAMGDGRRRHATTHPRTLRRGCCWMRTAAASRAAVRPALRLVAHSRVARARGSCSPAAWRRTTSPTRSVRYGPGRWMCPAGSNRRAGNQGSPKKCALRVIAHAMNDVIDE
jgi:hypothetical protein